jgi:hypothetical protein
MRRLALRRSRRRLAYGGLAFTPSRTASRKRMRRAATFLPYLVYKSDARSCEVNENFDLKSY